MPASRTKATLACDVATARAAMNFVIGELVMILSNRHSDSVRRHSDSVPCLAYSPSRRPGASWPVSASPRQVDPRHQSGSHGCDQWPWRRIRRSAVNGVLTAVASSSAHAMTLAMLSLEWAVYSGRVATSNARPTSAIADSKSRSFTAKPKLREPRRAERDAARRGGRRAPVLCFRGVSDGSAPHGRPINSTRSRPPQTFAQTHGRAQQTREICWCQLTHSPTPAAQALSWSDTTPERDSDRAREYSAPVGAAPAARPRSRSRQAPRRPDDPCEVGWRARLRASLAPRRLSG
jgi:hypothetical protein